MVAMAPNLLEAVSISVVVCFIFVYVWFRHRERSVGAWAIGWGVYFISAVLERTILLSGHPGLAGAATGLASLVTACAFFIGTRDFLHLKKDKVHPWGALIAASWTILANALGLTFLHSFLPVCLLVGATLEEVAYRLLRAGPDYGVGRFVAAASFSLWGLHHFGYPFMREMPRLALLGYDVVEALEPIIAVSLLSVYFLKVREDLSASEQRFRLLAENARDIVFRYHTKPHMEFEYVSPAVSTILGHGPEEFYADSSLPSKLIHPNDLPLLENRHHDHAPEEIRTLRWVRPDGSVVWTEERDTHLRDHMGKVVAVEGIIRDVTARMEAQTRLEASQEKFYQAFNSSPAAMAIRMLADFRCVDVNRAWIEIVGYSRDEVIGRTPNELPGYVGEGTFARAGDLLSSEGSVRNLELAFCTKDGDQRTGLLSAEALKLDGSGPMALFALTDVTEREEMIDELRYQGQHDSLTGLLNRTAFEDEMDRAEEKCGKGIGLIMCDVDGLKIVNDTLGHLAGDDLLRSTGMILRSCFREGDAIARIGGDEFAVLMTGCDSEAVETACRRLRHAVAFSTVGQTDLPLSLSVGGASTDGEARSMKALYKEADDNMYREKLTRKRSSHSGVTQALMRTLKARDHKTLDHAERLQAGVKLISERLGLSQDTMNRLQLLAQFHDIGKVGIPDRILFKPGPLTPAERAEMQRHSEIGYRIAQSSVDLQPIADLILNHHEWWNGMGYPHGLEGETIPIECRILAVMDAYDAMISDRPYRAAMSHADAVAELERCAGTQFDPNLVSKMLDVLAAWALDAAIDEANDGLKVALP